MAAWGDILSEVMSGTACCLQCTLRSRRDLLTRRQGKVASEAECRGRFPGLEAAVGQVFAVRSTRASGETSVSQDSVPAPSTVAIVDTPVVPQNIGRFVVVRVIDRTVLANAEKSAEAELDSTEGHIGLQSWRNPVKFRNIRV